MAVRLAIAAPALIAVLAFLPLGLRGTRIVPLVWPAIFGGDLDEGESLRRLEEAAALWPQYDLAIRVARGRHEAATRATGDAGLWRRLLEQARGDYLAAHRLNRFEPVPVVNGADIDSMLGRDADAERGYEHGIRLQGGMEAAFHGHAMQAGHFMRKTRRLHEAGDAPGALQALRSSAAEIEKANAATRATTYDRNARIFIHESLGASLEAAADWEGALRAYDLASSVPGGSTAHFRAGRLLAEEAGKRWMKRRSDEALFLFLAAKDRIEKSHGAEVPGFTAEQRRAIYQKILADVKALEAGKISPKAVPLGQ